MEESDAIAVKKSELSTQMDTEAPALEARASSGDLDGAVDALFLLEKKCRMVRAFSASAGWFAQCRAVLY
jgi:hypothetical protein